MLRVATAAADDVGRAEVEVTAVAGAGAGAVLLLLPGPLLRAAHAASKIRRMRRQIVSAAMMYGRLRLLDYWR